MRNLKLAFRTLFKTPFVTVIAILSLALGIGANAAIYSLFNQILRRPLPVSHPEELVNLASPGPQFGSNSCNDSGGCEEVFSYPMFRDLEKGNTGFAGLAAHRLLSANVAMTGQTPVNGQLALVSGSYFPVLGVRPTIGRLINVQDDAAIGANYVAVLNYAFWETQLGSNPNVLGQKITVNGQQFTIIGVGPRGFNGTTMSARPYVYIPITMRAAISQGRYRGFEQRNNYWVYLFARRKPGVSLEQAQNAVNTVFHPSSMTSKRRCKRA